MENDLDLGNRRKVTMDIGRFTTTLQILGNDGEKSTSSGAMVLPSGSSQVSAPSMSLFVAQILFQKLMCKAHRIK